MFAVTDAAAEAIRSLTNQEGQEQNAGLRFVVHTEQESEAQLAVAVADEPENGDQVLGPDDGAKVFLEPQAAQLLDDKLLDVQQDEQGQLNFAVMPQSGS